MISLPELSQKAQAKPLSMKIRYHFLSFYPPELLTNDEIQELVDILNSSKEREDLSSIGAIILTTNSVDLFIDYIHESHSNTDVFDLAFNGTDGLILLQTYDKEKVCQFKKLQSTHLPTSTPKYRQSL